MATRVPQSMVAKGVTVGSGGSVSYGSMSGRRVLV